MKDRKRLIDNDDVFWDVRQALKGRESLHPNSGDKERLKIMKDPGIDFNKFIESERLYLREVRPSDVNELYYAWMNDDEVTRYTESRFRPQAMESIEQYVRERYRDLREIFLAIVVKEGDRHIGNIKIGPINWIHRFADVGLIIGEKEYWGRGYGTEAIEAVSSYAFDKLNLHKLTAGCYTDNQASAKAFKKAGFQEEGIRTQQYFLNGRYVDLILLGLVRSG